VLSVKAAVRFVLRPIYTEFESGKDECPTHAENRGRVKIQGG
jgi:hypothetical protein